MGREGALRLVQPSRGGNSHGKNGPLAKSQDLRHSFRLTPNQVKIGIDLDRPNCRRDRWDGRRCLAGDFRRTQLTGPHLQTGDALFWVEQRASARINKLGTKLRHVAALR